MRKLTDHKLNGLNDSLEITVRDEPGAGGASCEYHIGAELLNPVEKYPAENSRLMKAQCSINFQNGSPQEVGINGISNESLIAVVIDRLRGFQAGKFSSEETGNALDNLEKALFWLQKRTRERLERGVEGTYLK